MMSQNKKCVSVALIILTILAAPGLACGAFQPGSSPANPQSSPTATVTPITSGGDAPDLPTPVKQPNADCPHEIDAILTANHDFKVDTGMGAWQWQASGQTSLWFDELGNPNTIAPQTFSGQVFGTFSSGRNTCSFNAPASISLTAAGSCENGIVTLEITEAWTLGTHDWQCDDEAFKSEVPSGIPAVHPNLVFNIVGELEGITVQVPFAGGSGTKSWTLYPPPVPIIP